jgi:hypothetical protein
VAVALAALIVLTVEIVLHCLPTGALLGYGDGLGSYYEVRHSIELQGAAEVAILGESRAREAVLMPMLDGLCETLLGRDVRTANYACPDARTTEMLLVTKEMLGSARKPALVMYLISPRGLLRNDRNLQREEVFGVFPDVCAGNSALALASLAERPMWDLRNGLQKVSYTFRYRYRFRNFLASAPRQREMLSPIQGDYTTWQRYVSNRSLVSHPVSDAHIRDYVARLLDENGEYVLGDSRVAALRDIAKLCAEAGVELVLVSAPISDDLARLKPAGLMERFDGTVRTVAEEMGVRYLTAADLGVSLDRGDFREQSHLNRNGAEKMTRALVEQIIVPELSGRQGSSAGS